MTSHEIVYKGLIYIVKQTILHNQVNQHTQATEPVGTK